MSFRQSIGSKGMCWVELKSNYGDNIPMYILVFVIETVEGKLTDGSGFSCVISEAGVLTSDRSEAVSSPAPDHRLEQRRYVHQVFLLAGSILKLSRPIKHQTVRVRRVGMLQ